ncbi:MAG: HAD-IC family P-type ATPase, partial [Christensenellales bacterium]
MKKKTQEPIERFEAAIEKGLDGEQVKLRQSQKLTNAAKKSSGKSYTRIVCENVFTFFNFLWLAIFVALLAVGSYNNLLFAIIIVANTLIAIIQECKAKRTVSKLQLVVAPKIATMRDGKQIEISSNDIVLDDIIILENGNQIPADCEILDGVVDVNESLLTGESVSIKKTVGSKLLAGSFLTSGKCVCRVVAVGEGNYISSVAKAAKGVSKPKSNLFKDLNKLIKIIGYFILPIGILMFLNNFYGQDTNIATAVEKTCGSLVGMIPAGMFLLVTVALAVGVIKLSKKKTLVQDLYSIEMLARTNVLCLDKTGTITDGTMQVREIVRLEENRLDIDGIIKSINCAQPTENATSLALKKFYGTENVIKPAFNLAFSSERKQTITCFSGIGTFALGAYEYINTPKNKSLEMQISKYSEQGYRVIVLAKNDQEISEEKELEFSPIALIVIEDHIRSDAPDTIKWFKDNGVEIKIISGDNPQTVASIAKKVGVEGAEKFVSLEKMSIKEVCEIADKFTVFGRVSPEQKHAIIKTLKQKGKVVAMTGDGVNDTLALKEADCSIAMADGSEVARSISNLVLMNSKFSSLPSVVAEGRQVINNVQKSSSLFLMKTLFTVVLSLVTLCTF